MFSSDQTDQLKVDVTIEQSFIFSLEIGISKLFQHKRHQEKRVV